MELSEAMRARHSVRSYTDKKIEGAVLDALRGAIGLCNQESGLHMQLCLDEPEAFSGRMARYGSFRNVRNYIALVGKKGADLQEKCGYYGEKLVLEAQRLGLNTCWVALTFSKGKSKKNIAVDPGEKLLMVISLGYGENQGKAHKQKPIEEHYEASGELPDWFRNGLEAARLAPTATNQQKYKFILKEDGKVSAIVSGAGFYTKTDLGIVKYHFEQGSGSGQT
jgi:nitroreductase